MRILLTGATGFLGQAISKAALLRGHDLVVLTRDAESLSKRYPYPCRSWSWDPEREVAPLAAFEGVDAVIHLAGESVAAGRWTQEQKKRILDSRVLGTRHLRETIASASGVQTWVSASAIGYYPQNSAEDPAWTEDASPGSDFLAQVCQAWEAELESPGTERVRKVALRIGIVLGRGGGALERLLPLFRAGLGGPIGNGRQVMSWIHERDLVRAFLHAVECPELRGPVNAVAPTPASNSEFTQALAHAVGKPAWIPAPQLALKIALGEMSQVVLASQKVTSTKWVTTGLEFEFPSLAAALEEIAAPDGERGADVFEAEQFVPQAPDQVFGFFSDAANLERITPPLLKFQILGSSGPLGNGTLIDYRLKVHGAPMHWKTRIENWDPPRRFSDRQLRGPYQLWFHTHEFEAVAGGTLMSDRVVYRVPLGSLGRAAAGWLVRRDVKNIFEFRRGVIGGLFKAGALVVMFAATLFVSLPMASAAPCPTEPAVIAEAAALSQRPSTAETLALRARLAYFEGRVACDADARRAAYVKGIEYAEAARRLQPAAPQATLADLWWGANLGSRAELEKSLNSLREIKRIETLLQEVAQRDPAFGRGAALRALGRLYQKAPSIISVGSVAKAGQNLRAAFRLAPDFAANQAYLADFLFEREEYDEARKLARQVMASNDLAREPLEALEWSAIARSVLDRTEGKGSAK